MYNACKKCSRYITKYTTRRVVESPYDEPSPKTYKLNFCWGCGYFSIYPNIRDDFTVSILRNRFLILELIENKELVPIL